ncbi:hypothetical protein EYC84_011396 [Monilinia fructicola]|uniref:Uncharacterized protein n=1 Tax=Monilinia fructicola TaxID=38448 RepID=A0A5M9J868_MONFR|nr:hypothetical protein EYC84_011396 [Monilinia fructicola]
MWEVLDCLDTLVWLLSPSRGERLVPNTKKIMPSSLLRPVIRCLSYIRYHASNSCLSNETPRARSKAIRTMHPSIRPNTALSYMNAFCPPQHILSITTIIVFV